MNSAGIVTSAGLLPRNALIAFITGHLDLYCNDESPNDALSDSRAVTLQGYARARAVGNQKNS
jgi:hypothetical protein